MPLSAALDGSRAVARPARHGTRLGPASSATSIVAASRSTRPRTIPSDDNTGAESNEKSHRPSGSAGGVYGPRGVFGERPTSDS